jgi:hypothetical protein
MIAALSWSWRRRRAIFCRARRWRGRGMRFRSGFMWLSGSMRIVSRSQATRRM